ncbi:hypothetical protein [Aeromonas enteropelogenes]|uniref:hypothetical protein n=1 Tax=Aeromonas enteropelogenes TaxID=29489 RepID=UPI003BA35ED9
MEAQTLQQETPVYHVCQECGGDGCIHCSDLCIVYGDIEFNVDECIRDIQLDPEWNDELPEESPINGVIGVNSSWKPAYEFIVVWKENGQSFNKCFTNESESLAHFEALIGRASSLYMTYPDGQTLTGASK